MSAAPDILHSWGVDLTPDDLAKLVARWITPELAEQAGIRRVDSITGCAMFNRKRDMAGLIIPNIFPGTTSVRDYRLRLDHPDYEIDINGNKRETGMKYIGPIDRPPLIYFSPGVTSDMLLDTSLPVIVTEGEFKAMALWRLAWHESDQPRFLPIAVQGVDCWRGTIGHTNNASGKRVAIKGMLPDLAERMAWKGRKVIVAYDADIATKDSVERARARLTYAVTERGAEVGFLEWPITEGKGIDDRLFNVGPEKVLADIANVQFGDWKIRLLRNADGKMITCYENVALYLENAPEWAGALGYNEFTGGHVVLRQGPVSIRPGEEIEDHFDTEVTRWLERHHLMAKPDMARKVVDVIARKNSFHPVRDYLESLPAWDKVPRIGTWLIDYCGVESSDVEPNLYAMAVGEKFLISAAARILDPGCKVDYLLILEGPQDLGKSTVPRILAGDEYFTDQLADIGNKDADMQLRGCWIIEFGELDAFNRPEMTKVKAFLTRQTDRFRLPYGHRVVKFPRQCVFIGTTNKYEWLKDETGGRRFWPVRCSSKIDLPRLRADRDLLWSEALHQYRAGVHWWLEDAEVVALAKEEQTGRYMPDPWQETVERYADALSVEFVDGPKAFSVKAEDILKRIVTDPTKQDQPAMNRVSRCLHRASWERKNLRKHGEPSDWRYRKVPCSTK